MGGEAPYASVSLVPSSTPATRNLTNSSKTKSSTASPSLQRGRVGVVSISVAFKHNFAKYYSMP